MEQNEIVERKPAFLVRAWKWGSGGIMKALGQLATKQFWLGLMKSIAHEMVTSFVKTIGLGFLGYGKERGTIVNEPMTANKAFNGVNGANYARPEFNQPMYGGRSDFSRPDIRSYPPASQGQSFSGF